MKSIHLTAHADENGVLNLHVPVDIKNADMDVIVVFNTVVEKDAPEAQGWPPEFFERTFGCMKDDPLVREDQGEYEVREELL